MISMEFQTYIQSLDKILFDKINNLARDTQGFDTFSDDQDFYNREGGIKFRPTDLENQYRRVNQINVLCEFRNNIYDMLNGD